MPSIAESQACEGWGILTSLAAEGEHSDTYSQWSGSITYEELADLLGTHAHALVPMLDLIMNHCRANGLPPLTGLVVLKEAGVPSDGFPPELTPRIEDVYTFDWESVDNPFAYAREG